MQNENKNSNLQIEEPIYVYFDYNGTKVSELFIPTETKSLSDLITENSFKYKIPKDFFFDLVLKNRINLSENNSFQGKNQNNLKIQEPVFHNFLDSNDLFNSDNSTRSNTNKNLKGMLINNNDINYFPNSHEGYEMPKQHNKKEMIYNEILACKDNEIPKGKLLELTSNLLENTNKYLQEHKNFNNNLIININNNNLNKLENNLKQEKDKNDSKNYNYNNLISVKNKNLNEVADLNLIANNKIKNNLNNKSNLNLHKIPNTQNKSDLRNKSNLIINSVLPINGLNGLKSPRSVKIDLNMVSGKCNKKSALTEKDYKTSLLKINKYKEPKSPRYNFLNQNHLLVKNYKRVLTYSEKEAFAKQIKGNMNQERLNSIIDNNTYGVYNYKKILSDNNQNSTEYLALEKPRICLTNPAENLIMDSNSKNDDALIENLDNKLISPISNNHYNNNKTDEENLNAFSNEDLIDINMYNDINRIVSTIGDNISNNLPSNKISTSNAKYVSLKNKLDNLSNDYVLNLNSKNSKNIINKLLNLNFNTASNANNPNNNFHFKNDNNEFPDEKLIGSETMSEKSSFLFNNGNRASGNFEISNNNTRKNSNYIINKNNNNNNDHNFLNSNLNTTTNFNNNFRESTSRSKIKSLTSGANLINKLKKNQLLFCVSKSERSVSYGERLFYKGKLFEEKKGKKTEIYRKMKDAEFEKNCTFKPKINPNSIALSVKANFSNLGASSVGNAGELLNNFSNPNFFNNNNNNKYYNENIENNLYHCYNNIEKLSNFNYSGNFSNKNNYNGNDNNSNVRYKNKQCNHNPMLNNTVNFNENDKANLTSVYSHSKILNKTCFKTPEEIELVSKRLHDNAERYRNKKLQLQESFYAQTCPFAPEIISREEGEIPNMDNFFNRLQTWVDKRNEKYEQDLEKKHFDERTGNRLFSPQIRKSKKHKVIYFISIQIGTKFYFINFLYIVIFFL
jgi:hypothetical protein